VCPDGRVVRPAPPPCAGGRRRVVTCQYDLSTGHPAIRTWRRTVQAAKRPSGHTDGLARWRTRSSTVCCVTTRIIPTGRPADRFRAFVRARLDVALRHLCTWPRQASRAPTGGRPRDPRFHGPNQALRQLHSPCAGHPERGEASGIETTTGPLGQGLGNSVGMAIAQRWLAAHFTRPGFELFGYDNLTPCAATAT